MALSPSLYQINARVNTALMALLVTPWIMCAAGSKGAICFDVWTYERKK